MVAYVVLEPTRTDYIPKRGICHFELVGQGIKWQWLQGEKNKRNCLKILRIAKKSLGEEEEEDEEE